MINGRVNAWFLVVPLIVCAYVSSAFSDDTFDKLIESKSYSEALNYADAKIPAPSRDSKIWAKLGRANEGQGLIEKALACYMVAQRMDAKSYDASIGIARIYNKLNQPANAAIAAKKALELKNTSEASWEFARACIALNKAPEAKKALEKVVNDDPENIPAQKELGLIYYNEKAYDKSIDLLKTAYAKQPDDNIAYRIGKAYNEAGSLDSALVYLKGPNNRKVSSPEASIELGNIYFKLQKFDAAIGEYDKGLSKNGGEAMDYYQWAVSLEKSNGGPDRIMKAYQGAVDKFGTSRSKEALLSRSGLGEKLLEKKNFQNALPQFQAIYAHDSTGKLVADINGLLAACYEGMDNTAKAISCWEREIRLNASNVEAYAHLGDLYTKEGQVEKARLTYEKMVSINPNNDKVQMMLGEYYLKAKKYQEALKYYQKSYTVERSAKAAEGMALSAMALGRTDMARDAAESALRIDGSLFDSRVVLSKIYLKEKNYKDAIDQVDALAKKDPGNKELWQQLALCYEQTKDLARLAEADKRIISLDARNINSRTRLARYSLAQNDTKTAYDLYKELTALEPGDAEAFKCLYDISLQKGNKDEAIAYLKRYVALKPGVAEAHRNLGELLYDKKQFDGALEAYRAAVRLDPELKGVYKHFAEILLTKGGEQVEVMSVLNGAISTGEADAGIYAALGTHYHKSGNYPKAIDMFQKSLQMDPKNTAILTTLAECQAKNGNAKEAIVTYEQAVSMNPAAVQEYKALADLYQQQNNQSQAIAMYKKYLEKKPSDMRAARTVADYVFGQKNYEEAAKYFEMIKGEDTKKADFLFRYGQACYNSKNYKKALELCRQVAVLTPLNAEVFKILFDIASHDNTLKNDATAYLKKYVALRPGDAPAQKNLGDVLYDQKDYAGALAAYRSAIKADPGLRGIYKQYVEMVMQHGTREEIIKALTGAIAAGEADAAMYSELGSSYQKQAAYPKAIEMYQKSLQLDSKNTGILSALAMCQAKNGDVQQATITFEQALAMKPNAVQEYKALGDLYLQQNKKDQAIAAYKKYLEKDSSNTAIVMAVADFEYKANDFDEALRFLNMVHGEDAKKASFLFLYGQACYQSKNCTKSASIFKQLALLMPQNADVFKTLFDISIKSSNTSDAIAALKRYVAIKPADAAAQKQLGDFLYDQKDMGGAMAAYGAALKADPTLHGFFKRYSEIVSGKGSQEQIVSVLTAAIKADEADGPMYAALASMYQQQNACAKAIPYYQKALQLDTKNNAILPLLAACQAKTGAINDAVVTYEEAVVINPAAQAEYKALGDLYMKQNKAPQAIEMYRKYLEKVPHDNEVASIVGENAMKEKNYPDAVKYLGIALPSKANNLEFLFTYAQACYLDALAQSKNFKKPIEILERMRSSAKVVPHNTQVLKMLADSYDRMGDTTRAVALYIGYTKIAGVRDQEASYRKAQLTEKTNPALAAKMYEDNTLLFPQDYRNFLNAGLYYAKHQAASDKALALLKKCTALADSFPVVWMELGQVYGRLGRDKDEVEAYRQFIQRDPTNPEASGKIGEILLAKHNVNDAMVFLETANALKPNEAHYMMLLARGYVQTDRPNEAIDLLEKTEKLRPDDVTIKEQLYALYDKKGDAKNALNEMKQLVEKKRDSKYMLKYAQALYANGVYSDAENIIKDIRATEPENLDALMLQGKILGVLGKWDEALETYKEVSYINPNYAPGLYERAEIHLMQSKIQWARTFYERAIKADPKYVLAEIGLAKISRVEKNKTDYLMHIENAKKIDPNNKALQDELVEGKKLLR
jgi:Predicted N-acetylglucosaminyl transferase